MPICHTTPHRAEPPSGTVHAAVERSCAALPQIRQRLLQMHAMSKTGHIGGSLSCLEALTTLYHDVMQPTDHFILSKGHAAGALYTVLWSKGLLSDAALHTFCQNDTILPGHPSGNAIPGVQFATGSLGHGPSLACGLALGLRDKGMSDRVFCLCSDGEWQEGSTWEALTFALRHQLGAVTLLVDQNRWQGFGSTREVCGTEDLTPRFAAFGAEVAHIDGHDPAALYQALIPYNADRPRVVVLETCKGRGLAFADQLASHYLPLSPKECTTLQATCSSSDCGGQK